MTTVAVTRPDEGATSGYERVLGFLREQLLSGRLKSGDFLLPERELSLQLGVSRPVLREALRALSLIGAVEVRHGVGTIVGRPSISAVGEYFTFVLAQQPDVVEDIMESRIAVEHRAIRLACVRATQSDFNRIEAAYHRIEQTISDPAAGSEADFGFHDAIVKSAHSPSLQGIYGAIANLMLRSHKARRERIIKLDGINEYLINHHRLIFVALLDRDAERADKLLGDHFVIAQEFERRATREASGAT